MNASCGLQINSELEKAQAEWLRRAAPRVVPTASKHAQTESSGEIGPPLVVTKQEVTLSKMQEEQGPIMTQLQLFARIAGSALLESGLV